MKTYNIGGVRIHEFSHTADAYDASQGDEVKRGDLLWSPLDGVVAVADSWPTAITSEHGKLHCLHDDYQDWGSLPVAYGLSPSVIAVAFQITKHLNLKVHPIWGQLFDGIAQDPRTADFEPAVLDLLGGALTARARDEDDEDDGEGGAQLLRLENGHWEGDEMGEWVPSGTGFVLMPDTPENIAAVAIIMGLSHVDLTWALEECGECDASGWLVEYVPASANPRKAWLAGYNKAGFLCDEDPAEFETSAEAWQYIKDKMGALADNYEDEAELENDAERKATSAALRGALRQPDAEWQGECSLSVGGLDFWVRRA